MVSLPALAELYVDPKVKVMFFWQCRPVAT